MTSLRIPLRQYAWCIFSNIHAVPTNWDSETPIAWGLRDDYVRPTVNRNGAWTSKRFAFHLLINEQPLIKITCVREIYVLAYVAFIPSGTEKTTGILQVGHDIHNLISLGLYWIGSLCTTTLCLFWMVTTNTSIYIYTSNSNMCNYFCCNSHAISYLYQRTQMIIIQSHFCHQVLKCQLSPWSFQL